MKRKLNIWLIGISALACILLSACGRRDIVDLHDIDHELNIAFDWTAAPDARCNGMSVIFFPTDSQGNIWQFEINGQEGGKVKLPCGSYDVLAYNNDTPDVKYRNTNSFYNYSGYTLPTALSERDEDIDVERFGVLHHSGDLLYSAAAFSVDVTPCGVSYRSLGSPDGDVVKSCGKSIVRLFPRLISTSVTCEIEPAAAPDSILSFEGVLTGLAGSINMESGKPGSDIVAIPFPIGNQPHHMFSGNFLSFGRSSGSPQNILLLIAHTTANNTNLYKIDVTQQIVNSPNPLNVLIKIKDIGKPVEITTDSISPGGIDAGVAPWINEEIDLSC